MCQFCFKGPKNNVPPISDLSRTEISRKPIPHNAKYFKFSNREQINRNKIFIKSLIAEATRKYKETPGCLFESFSQQQEPLG